VQPRLEDGDQVLLRIVVTVDGFPAGPTPLLPGGDLLQERPAPLRGALGTGVELILWAVCVRVGGGGGSPTQAPYAHAHTCHMMSASGHSGGYGPGPGGLGDGGRGDGGRGRGTRSQGHRQPPPPPPQWLCSGPPPTTLSE